MKEVFRDQVAIVTGASSGIGRAVALALARQGARVALAARTTSALRAIAEEITRQGREAIIIPTDVTQRDQVNRLIAEVLQRWQRIDILVASAGAYVRSPISTLDVTDLERSMAINFYGAIYAILAVLPHMLQTNSGTIAVISSMDGRKGLPLDAPYVSAKFALTGFCDVLRQELYGTGVWATTILPGRVDTPMIATLRVPWISPKISPEAVARATIRAIRRRQPEVVVPPHAKVLDIINTLSPRFADWGIRTLGLQGEEEAIAHHTEQV